MGPGSGRGRFGFVCNRYVNLYCYSLLTFVPLCGSWLNEWDTWRRVVSRPLRKWKRPARRAPGQGAGRESVSATASGPRSAAPGAVRKGGAVPPAPGPLPRHGGESRWRAGGGAPEMSGARTMVSEAEVGGRSIIKSRAEPSRAEPSRAEPSRAEPSRAEPLFMPAGAHLAPAERKPPARAGRFDPDGGPRGTVRPSCDRPGRYRAAIKTSGARLRRRSLENEPRRLPERLHLPRGGSAASPCRWRCACADHSLVRNTYGPEPGFCF